MVMMSELVELNTDPSFVYHFIGKKLYEYDRTLLIFIGSIN